MLNTKLELKWIKNLKILDVLMVPKNFEANTISPAIAIASKATYSLLKLKQNLTLQK